MCVISELVAWFYWFNWLKMESLNAKRENPNVKWLMSNDKRTTARPLLAVIGPVFPFRGLLSSVSDLVFAVCGPNDHGHGHDTRTVSGMGFGQKPLDI